MKPNTDLSSTDLASALRSIAVPDVQRERLRVLHQSADGIAFVEDGKGALQGRAIDASRKVGSAVKRALGITTAKPFGMSFVGHTDPTGTRWRMNANFRAAVDALGWFNSGPPPETAFWERVERSLADEASTRAARLIQANPIPEPRQVITWVFDRNPDVVAQVLQEARGHCQRCGHSAPFVRKSNGTPYLEVHHLTPLADGGRDTVDNAVALCPNCHREMHHGV